MIVSVKSAKYLDAYRLNLVFDTGESGNVELQDLVFKYAAASPLRDINYFKSFKLDECPETLCERATGKSVNWIQ
jgi:hypothetical protein